MLYERTRSFSTSGRASERCAGSVYSPQARMAPGKLFRIAAGLAGFLALALLSRAVAVPEPSLPLVVLLSLAVYGGTAALLLYAAHRWVRPLQRTTALLLALAPLLLTGPATLRGAVYAPLDINFLFEPLTAHRPEAGIVWVQTPV